MTERITLFATVVLPLPIHQEFTYRVPLEMNQTIFVGGRVVVPFGKSKLLSGIVTSLSELAPKEYQAKFIEYQLDDRPIITKQQYQLWRWIANYYLSPIGDVMNAALPSNLKIASETQLVVHPDVDVQSIQLTEKEHEILELIEMRGSIDVKELSVLIQLKNILPLVKKMIDKRLIMSKEELNEKFTPKTAVFVLLHDSLMKEELLERHIAALEEKTSASKQLKALLSILSLGKFREHHFEPILRKDLLVEGISQSTLNSLEKNGCIVQERLQISRIKNNKASDASFKELSPAQKRALDDIHEKAANHTCTLLHGVTGSGKTEIYVQLIQEQLDLGKQVLYLLPEIALTTQLIQRLSAYFGEQIGVYHSKFNQNERVEIWNHVLENNPSKFRVILGARSAIFLPFQDLGLIIVDEEHESTFKQYDPSPRYNARDLAIVLGHLFNAKVLLGSATPSLESYYNAQQGKYGLVTLTDRYGAIQMPEVFCADVKKERKQKTMQTHFTSFLLEAIREALEKKEQVILFQNRRGYTPLWSCEICNWTPKCNNCDVSLTYHKHSNLLKCHYCGYSHAPLGSCRACGSNRLKMIGFGTEKIEDDLSIHFPQASIQRLDLDTTRAKNAYETLLNDFENRNIDILIGTQMVSKGLDFDNVSLVGILDADMLLNRPDFRAYERSFQLMTQVAGRAGRKKKRGKVIIQTGDPDHWVIRKVIDHDFVGFYDAEQMERKNFFYPPFFKIISFTLKHKEEGDLNAAADAFAKALKEVFKERVIGPEFPVIRRIQNFYLKSIVLKIEKDASDKKVKEHLQHIIDAFFSVPSHKSIRLIVDVDPA